MRLINVPPVARIACDPSPKHPEGVREFPFKEWLTFVVEAVPDYGRGYAMMKRATTLLSRIEASEATLSLEDDDYVTIEKGLENVPFNPKHAKAFLPYFEAFMQAEKIIGPAK